MGSLLPLADVFPCNMGIAPSVGHEREHSNSSRGRVQSSWSTPPFTTTQLYFLECETLVVTHVVWRSPSWNAQGTGVRSSPAHARGTGGGSGSRALQVVMARSACTGPKSAAPAHGRERCSPPCPREKAGGLHPGASPPSDRATFSGGLPLGERQGPRGDPAAPPRGRAAAGSPRGRGGGLAAGRAGKRVRGREGPGCPRSGSGESARRARAKAAAAAAAALPSGS